MKDYGRVFKIFKDNYKLVPLEIFGKNPYKSLISTILSSRTNDDTTLKVSKKLFKKAPNIKSLNKLSVNSIKDLIYPVSFYITKATHLKKTAEEIIKSYDGKVPKTREELMNLPGVGRKTANLVLNRAFDVPAIAADTHVHKISNLLGWVKTKNPEETEKELNKTLPKKYWSDMNRLFVSIGRQYTTKKRLENFLNEHRLLK